MEFIRDNINYPLQQGEKNLSGLVVIRMTIDKDGSASDFEVVKSLAERYDKEAVRIAALTDKMWIPATFNGEDIAFSYLLPIRYVAPRGRKK